MVDGTLAPPQGPCDVVIEHDRIAQVFLVGSPTARMQASGRPEPGPGGRALDLDGAFVLPGLFDCHGHIGAPNKTPSAQYVYNLWLGHGVTSVRDPGCFVNGLDFVRREADRSERDEIVAPRIHPYVGLGEGRTEPFYAPDEARAWVAEAAARGARGVKLFGHRPEIFRAVVEEASAQGLGTACHHSQPYVARANALVSSRWGLSSVEHWYGLPEALFEDRRVQHFPVDFNYENEQERFYQSGRSWLQAAEPGSSRWREVIDELCAIGATLDPTFEVYIGNRDVDRVRTSMWHADYTAPELWDFWQPSPANHGSVYYDWTTEMEVAWRHNYRRWMDFVRDFHALGGRVVTGTDAGSCYKLWGFGNVEEMELLRETGLHPLEIVHAATLASAELLGVDDRLGSVTPGKLADLLVVMENPLQNLKVLYGNGRLRLGSDGRLERAGGVRYTVKNGILYDAPELLRAVRDEVRAARARRGQEALEPLP